MKKLSFLALCVFMVACSSTPSVEESNAEYVVDDIDTIEDMNGIEDVSSLEDVAENEPLEEEALEMEGTSMQENVTGSSSASGSSSMSEAALSPEEEVRILRLEIEALKIVIADLRKVGASNTNMADANFKMQHDNNHIRPVDLVMKFDSMYDQKRWWNILEEAGIKDKFYSASNGQYLIFLGHFNDHKFALATKNKIIKATGAEAIEIITSTGG